MELFDAAVSVGREVGISWTWDPNDYKVNGNFIWKSEDESIAKLYSENRGMVRGISPGITTISATTTDGSNITATCTVRVVENIAVAILQDNGDLVFFRAKEIPNDLYDGDVTEVEYQDLVAAVRSSVSYVMKPYFIIEDNSLTLIIN